ncbi:DUF123 domain-containing protein [Malonomonas rubra]|uniref:GIY-YIG nuclease family protein n=1 Tax=Malonomonas rubra TaxID=57040 RepID=UPI0026EAC453|nr:GIY-YIG nuclease family protein [Malonomonas rubra]
MSNSESCFPSVPGSYLLVLYLCRRTDLPIGKLGCFSFPRGWYFYAGSAFGQGGLQGRLSHHLRPVRKHHWHIDYLRSSAELRAIWYQVAVNNEHLWSRELGDLSHAEFPVDGFGASDCECSSHLVYLSRRPGQRQLRAWLGGSGVRCQSLS